MIEASRPSPALPSGRTTVRIAVVDALAVSRDALRLVLGAETGFSVVGAACDGAEAVSLVRAQCPHVLLLDVAMPRVDGLDALRQLRDSGTGVPTVVVADAMAGLEVVAALTLGARGVLFDDAWPAALCDCVRAVAQGDYWIDKTRAGDVVEAWDRVRAEPWLAPAVALTRAPNTVPMSL
jgi:DNA-binding NarL/FixJ family response regulator